MLRRIAILLGCLLPLCAWAQTGGVKGKITDQESGESMIGVTVLIKGTSQGGITDLDGNFTIENVKVGSQVLMVSYIGYENMEIELKVEAGKTVDLGEIKIISEATGLEEVEIFADMVQDRKTPVAVSNVTAQVLNEQLGGMQLPEILNSTPGVYATPGSGAFADARINIRGFDQTEVLFMINGVPLNDMENGAMYWSNFAGLSEITRNMQVQRGLGASKLAVNSVGGTVNILTKSAENKKGGRAEVMFGNASWNNRYRLTLNTGKLDGGWSFTFQGSRTTGDGYIEGAYADSWSYFFTGSKEINDKHTLLLTVFGAPTDRGRVFSTSTAEYERYGSVFYNPAVGYDVAGLKNVSQNYSHKPQATLMHLWEINPKMFLTTSVYTSIANAYGTSLLRGSGVSTLPATSGEGYQDFAGMRAANESSENAQYIIESRHNNHIWYGAISNLNYQVSDQTSLVLGLDVRDYTAGHYGKVHDLLGGEGWVDEFNGVDNNILTPDRVARLGDRIRYDYDGNVRWGSVFAQVEHTVEKFTAFASSNISRTQMWREGNFWNGSSGNIDNSYGPSDKRVFNNFNVKAGLNYRFNARHNAFANAGYFNRAPYLRNAFVDSRFNNTYLEGLTNEKVQSVELGYSYRSSRLQLNFNLYRTRWDDRAFSRFFTDPTTGEQIFFSIVGQQALHQGFEAEAQLNVIQGLELRGMVSIGDWNWSNNVNTTVVNDRGENLGTALVASEGLPVGNTAQTTAFLGAHYSGIKNLYMGFRLNFFDRVYEEYDPADYQISNEAEADFLPPVRELQAYYILDMYAGYYFNFGENRARISANVHNVTDELYIRRANQRFGGENYGYGINYNIGLAVYF